MQIQSFTVSSLLFSLLCRCTAPSSYSNSIHILNLKAKILVNFKVQIQIGIILERSSKQRIKSMMSASLIRMLEQKPRLTFSFPVSVSFSFWFQLPSSRSHSGSNFLLLCEPKSTLSWKIDSDSKLSFRTTWDPEKDTEFQLLPLRDVHPHVHLHLESQTQSQMHHQSKLMSNPKQNPRIQGTQMRAMKCSQCSHVQV